MKPAALTLCCLVPLMGASIEGRVINTANGAGIGGVSITFAPPALVATAPRARFLQAVTEDSGAFHIANIPDGQYLPLVKKDGFVGTLEPMIWNSVLISGETQLNLQMTPLVSLRGRVLDPDKMPIVGQTVQAEGGSMVQAVTDKNGEFVLENLPPQSLILSAPVKIPAGTKDAESMVTTFFPSTPERERAEAIKVQGVDLSGYEIHMRTALVRKIRGVVLDRNDEPAAQATVGLTRAGRAGQVADDVEQVLTDDDGKFEFTPQQEGEWGVHAENAPEYDYESNRPITRSGSTHVRISSREPENVEIRLAQPFALDVATDWGDEADPGTVHPKVVFGLAPLDRQPTYSGQVNLNETRRIDGLFPGRYSVVPLISPPGYYVAAVLLDRRDILGQDVEISGPGTLAVVIRTGGGSLRGRGARGGAVVLMGPSGRILWTHCNAEGEFTIGDLPPGDYFVEAVQAGIPAIFDLVASPEFKNALASSGKRVKVEPGAMASIELPAILQP
jgi:hypothetical protein